MNDVQRVKIVLEDMKVAADELRKILFKKRGNREVVDRLHDFIGCTLEIVYQTSDWEQARNEDVGVILTRITNIRVSFRRDSTGEIMRREIFLGVNEVTVSTPSGDLIVIKGFKYLPDHPGELKECLRIVPDSLKQLPIIINYCIRV